MTASTERGPDGPRAGSLTGTDRPVLGGTAPDRAGPWHRGRRRAVRRPPPRPQRGRPRGARPAPPRRPRGARRDPPRPARRGHATVARHPRGDRPPRPSRDRASYRPAVGGEPPLGARRPDRRARVPATHGYTRTRRPLCGATERDPGLLR